VQWHRNQRICFGEQFASGARHPPPHQRRQIEPVAVFEVVHQRAGDIVVAYRGAGAVTGRRIGDGFHRQQRRPRIVEERDTEPGAVRRLGEGEFRPAGGAQADAIAKRLAAGRAQRRQRQIERQPQGPTPSAAKRAGGGRCFGCKLIHV
jgi:hypothetical protein